LCHIEKRLANSSAPEHQRKEQEGDRQSDYREAYRVARHVRCLEGSGVWPLADLRRQFFQQPPQFMNGFAGHSQHHVAVLGFAVEKN
jgi:hypothetical protein